MEQFNGVSYVTNEPLARHTTFRIGGPCDYFVEPAGAQEAAAAIAYCKAHNIPFFVMGNGSNLLAADEGYRGAVIHLAKPFSNIAQDGNVLTCEAGALLSAVAAYAQKHGLSGMECLAGIPGSIGGAVRMNAGAYGSEMKDIVASVDYIGEDGAIHTITDCGFSYRHSCFCGTGAVVTKVVLHLNMADPAEIKEKTDALLKQRREKQPVELPSAGSTFKRPPGHFAAALIDQAGLKGTRVGGAQVSEKHAGFVVNTGGATAEDVKALVGLVQDVVQEKFGVMLEREIIYL